MNRSAGRFIGRDWFLAALLCAVGLALRIPFRSHFAYHWDSAQFVLAINEYDIRLSQPHAPGYFLYIMLGRLVNGLVGDPHASLVWISIVFGSLLPAVVYLLATAMFGRKAGVTAGLLALTSPQVWFHSCVALTYCMDSFLVCTVVLVLWRAMECGGGWRDAIVVGALLALIGGVREQSVPALVPLVGFAFWKFERARLAKLVTAAVVAIGLGILWYVPMVRTSGGLRTYLDIVHLHAVSNASTYFPGGGFGALLKNVANITGFCGNGLMLGAVVSFVAQLHRALRMTAERKDSWDREHAFGLVVLAFWVVPMLIFGTVLVTNQPGHVLSYLPGLFVLVGAVVASLRSRWRRAVVIALICAGNVVAFVAWPPQWDGFFFGMARTARAIAEHDAQLSQIARAIRRTYSPKSIIVCFSQEYYLCGLRHFQLYLPEYEQYQFVVDGTTLHPPGEPMWLVRDGRLTFVAKLDVAGREGIVLVVPPGEKVDIFAPYLSLANAEALPQAENVLYFIPAQAVKLTR
ncbi:MAG TPA: glycosyltransferase family 39 protein [Verrucomicrobiae bacterium]|nr:glycosyltransferase family 39 protein [Verrucomicrobiae bacterium]